MGANRNCFIHIRVIKISGFAKKSAVGRLDGQVQTFVSPDLSAATSYSAVACHFPLKRCRHRRTLLLVQRLQFHALLETHLSGVFVCTRLTTWDQVGSLSGRKMALQITGTKNEWGKKSQVVQNECSFYFIFFLPFFFPLRNNYPRICKISSCS